MGCWSDFAPLIVKYISDFDDNDLAIATLQAAIDYGEDIGGFSDRYTTTLDGTVLQRSNSPCSRYVTVAVPVMPGWELVSVDGVSVNGVGIFQQAASPNCLHYSVDCNMVDIMPPPVGMNPVVSIDYSVTVVAGRIGADMPDFLYEKHNLPMTWKIIELLYAMREDHKAAAIYAQKYRQAKVRRKVRHAAGTATIDARSALWI